MATEIQWTWKFNPDGSLLSKGETWNFLSGCDKVSPACDNCYAKTLHDQRRTALLAGHPLPEQYRQPFEVVQVHPNRIQNPLSWRVGRRIFVNSVSDTFHKDVPLDILAKAWAVMAVAKRHTFLVLTKRIKRAEEVLSEPVFLDMVAREIRALAPVWGDKEIHALADAIDVTHPKKPLWPLPNVWIGVSVENQHFAKVRIPLLLKTPAAIRFLSCEPLLGYLDLKKYFPQQIGDGEGGITPFKTTGLDWVIGGGESGKNARVTHPDHARALRDDCAEFGVPFFWKQNGEWAPGECVPDQRKYPAKIRTQSGEPNEWSDCSDDWATEADNGPIMYRLGKKKAGRTLDGVEHNEYPKEING
jgi:protein gp37